MTYHSKIIYLAVNTDNLEILIFNESINDVTQHL